MTVIALETPGKKGKSPGKVPGYMKPKSAKKSTSKFEWNSGAGLGQKIS